MGFEKKHMLVPLGCPLVLTISGPDLECSVQSKKFNKLFVYPKLTILSIYGSIVFFLRVIYISSHLSTTIAVIVIVYRRQSTKRACFGGVIWYVALNL